MTMNVTDFCDKVLERFPPYRWDEPQEASYAEDAIRELSVFTPEVLERALRDLIRSRKKPGIPPIADLISACSEAKRWLKAEKDREQLPLEATERSPEWSPERVRLAYDLSRTDAGRKAARDGYAYRYWDHCRIERKVPTSAQCDKFKREADEHMRLVEELHRKAAAFQPKPMVAKAGFVKLGDLNLDHHWAKVGESMLARERRKASEILEGHHR